MRADVISDIRVPEPQAALVELSEDTVLATLFTTTIPPLPPPCERSKTHWS